jgi:hypothetical protein
MRQADAPEPYDPDAQLPEIDPDTLFLPPGIHECTMAEFEHVFVDSAPHPDHRRRRMLALDLFLEVVDALLPDSTLWLDGGFVSHKAEAPFDIDVLVKADPEAWLAMHAEIQQEVEALVAWDQAGQQGQAPKTLTLTTFGGLQTHQNAAVGGAVYPRIQPYGGYLDAFIFPADLDDVLRNFEGWWTTDFATGTRKGFVEVKPNGR